MRAGTYEFWEAQFGKPECARNYRYYGYGYLDDLSFMRSAAEVFGGWPHAERLVEEVPAKLGNPKSD